MTSNNIDSDVQLPPNSTGPLVDTSSVTTNIGTGMQRQRVVEGDAIIGANLAGVTQTGKRLVEDTAVINLLHQVLMELRMLNFMFREQSGQSVMGLKSSDFGEIDPSRTLQE